MARAGMPEDRSNFDTKPCGCETMRIAPTAHQGSSTVFTKRCPQHPKPGEEFKDRRSE